MLTDTIQISLASAIKECFGFQIEAKDINVDHPTQESFGDYTSNVAMKLVRDLPKEQKQTPIAIAQALAANLSKSNPKGIFSSIQASAPGFINFTFSDQYIVSKIVKSDSNDIKNQLIGKVNSTEKVMIEFLSPNTNKPLHIGHMRNAAISQSLVNISKYIGVDITSTNLNNDRGIHIIKSMFGFLYFKKEAGQVPVTTPYIEALSEWQKTPHLWSTPEKEGVKSDHFNGQCYIRGNELYEQSEAQQKEAGLISNEYPCTQMQNMLMAWESGDIQVRQLWSQMNSWFYAGMHQTLRTLKVKSPSDPSKFFDQESYESNLYQGAKDIILQNVGADIVECEDGHIEANLEKYNLPNIVLLRQNKTTLYITQDIELMRTRIQDKKIDKIVIVTGNEQDLRFKQLFAVCEILGISKLDQMVHLGYGMVRTPEGKMSSRKGTVILADDLIAEVESRALNKISIEKTEYSDIEKAEISQMVAIAALKYGILKYNTNSNIVFDIDTNIAFEGETGPYLQYTHARASAILRKYADKFAQDSNAPNIEFALEERELARHVIKFDDTIYKSAIALAPNYLCEYLFILCQKFNTFYANHSIINEPISSKRAFRADLVKKTQKTLQIGLSLLGIDAPVKM